LNDVNLLFSLPTIKIIQVAKKPSTASKKNLSSKQEQQIHVCACKQHETHQNLGHEPQSSRKIISKTTAIFYGEHDLGAR
jgi:topoisomerase IA-like protein